MYLMYHYSKNNTSKGVFYMCEEFKIIRILDEFSVVINGGYKDEIKRGDIFQIFIPGEDISEK